MSGRHFTAAHAALNVSRRRQAAIGLMMACTLAVSACSSGAGTAQASPHLTVTPARVLIDRPFAIRLTGLSAGQQVTIYCHYTDALSTPRQSYATFRADAHGVVDLASQAPIAGTYSGVDSMGLIWSVPVTVTDMDLTGIDLMGFTHPSTVTFTAKTGKRTIARATAQRYLLTGGVTHRSLRGKGLYGEFYRPAGKTGVPAVLVVGGSEGGVNAYVMREAALLAAHGYAALAPAYFGEPGLPAQLVNIPLEYFMHALDWLQQQPAVDPHRLAVMGTSRGGELALLLAAYDRRLKAAISYSGSGAVDGGLPASSSGSKPIPAWTLHGKPLLLYGHTLQDRAIPVCRINGPMLLIAGKDDQTWDATARLRIAMTQARAHHHPFADRLLSYAGAGHFIQPPYLAVDVSIGGRYGGDPRDQEHADVDSWAHIVRLLAKRFST